MWYHCVCDCQCVFNHTLHVIIHLVIHDTHLYFHYAIQIVKLTKYK